MGDKTLIWLSGEVQTPPFTPNGRVEAGYLLRLLQKGRKLLLPQSRPMSTIGHHSHELRIRDEDRNWRIIYSIGPDCIVILDVFEKRTDKTPPEVIKRCRERLARYEGRV